MSSLNDNDISNIINQELSDDLDGASASETEDFVEEDDVQSDENFEPSDSEESHISTPRDPSSTLQHDQASSSSSMAPETSSSSIIQLPQRNIRSKNRHVWATTKGHTSVRTSARNIVRTARGPNRSCRGITSADSCFELFFTNEIIEEIVKWTNVEISVKRAIYQTVTATQGDTNTLEIRALVGVLILSAALKDNHLTSDEIFNSNYCGSGYVAAMSRERFDFLVRCLRFDDRDLRLQRSQNDLFTPIRIIWDMLITQCRNNYTPGTNVTIDEQLLAFRGRCKFRMYIPNKPAKYGIKIEMMCDSGTYYMIDAIPYLGKGTDTGRLPLGEYFVKELTRTIHGTNRNVTTDNWFTSIPLAKSLQLEPYKLTLVGTLRANKREIPEELKNNRIRQVGSSIFCYDGPLTLVSFKSKPSKVVYLLSSCDEEGTVNTSTKKPHMIEFYNSTKGGVDTFDQMCSNMSSSRKTSRWPMCVFYGMINIACINSYIIQCHNLSTAGQKVVPRRNFMKTLYFQLAEPWLKTRLTKTTMPVQVKDKIRNVLLVHPSTSQGQQTSSASSGHGEESSTSSAGENRKRKTCGKCHYKKKRMTKSVCSKCKVSICGEHKIDFCVTCAKDV